MFEKIEQECAQGSKARVIPCKGWAELTLAPAKGVGTCKLKQANAVFFISLNDPNFILVFSPLFMMGALRTGVFTKN